MGGMIFGRLVLVGRFGVGLGELLVDRVHRQECLCHIDEFGW